MAKPKGGLPILLQSVHTYLSILCNIWMEDPGNKISCAQSYWFRDHAGVTHYRKKSTTIFHMCILAGALSLLQDRLQSWYEDVPLGGVWGKSLLNISFILNTPPSYGVPSAHTWIHLEALDVSVTKMSSNKHFGNPTVLQILLKCLSLTFFPTQQRHLVHRNSKLHFKLWRRGWAGLTWSLDVCSDIGEVFLVHIHFDVFWWTVIQVF